jgi:hypothetical protein
VNLYSIPGPTQDSSPDESDGHIGGMQHQVSATDSGTVEGFRH